MALDIDEKQTEGIAILDLRGRLVAGDEVSGFDNRLDAMLAQGERKVILDLKRVAFIDSTGLGVLVRHHTAFEKAGGALKLLHASKRHAELLILTKLSTVFQIFDDEQPAINSFFPDRAVPHFDILEFVKSEENREAQSGPASGEPKAES